MASLALLVLHLMCDLVWIGSILCVSFLLAELGAARTEQDRKVAAELAFGLYQKVASPAAYGALFFGIAKVLLDRAAYTHAHWFHVKFVLGLLILGLTHAIGGKAKGAAKAGGNAEANMRSTRNSAMLGPALLLLSVATVTLAVFKAMILP